MKSIQVRMIRNYEGWARGATPILRPEDAEQFIAIGVAIPVVRKEPSESKPVGPSEAKPFGPSETKVQEITSKKKLKTPKSSSQ